jgi:hypothetical protein
MTTLLPSLLTAMLSGAPRASRKWKPGYGPRALMFPVRSKIWTSQPDCRPTTVHVACLIDSERRDT